MKNVLRSTLFCFALFALHGCIAPMSPVLRPSPQHPDASAFAALEATTPDAIAQEYKANIVRANELYGGKWVKVDGYIAGLHEAQGLPTGGRLPPHSYSLTMTTKKAS